MKPVVALLLSILTIPAAFAAENTAKDFFARLAGDWQGAGEVRGMASAQKMGWEPVLDGKFLRLSFDNRMTGDDGKAWRFSAQAFYRIQDDGTIAGTWFDSRGVSFPLSGSIDAGDTLMILWGTDDSERGRTRYRLTATGLDVTDEVMTKEGGWRTFGRSWLTREP
jgi:hypothetical protein